MDNSVRALYEARKIESKLEQCKLLGIVTPTAIGMDAIKSKKNRSSQGEKCDYCGHSHKKGKQNCPVFGKTCNSCGQKNHFKVMCRSKDEGSKYEPRKCRPDRAKKCTHRCDVHEITECQDDTMEDLTDQVQSLFYH